jgi:hypothetical protein
MWVWSKFGVFVLFEAVSEAKQFLLVVFFKPSQEEVLVSTDMYQLVQGALTEGEGSVRLTSIIALLKGK